MFLKKERSWVFFKR